MHRLFTEEKAMFFCAFPASSPSSSFVCASVLCAPGPVSPFSPSTRGRPRSSAVFHFASFLRFHRARSRPSPFLRRFPPCLVSPFSPRPARNLLPFLRRFPPCLVPPFSPRPLAAVPVPPPFSALPRFFLSFRRTRWNKARPKALSRLAPPGFLTGWWTGRPASPPRPPLVFAESPWLSGGGACKAATSAPEHGRFRRKRRSSPPYTPPGTTRARKGLALSRSPGIFNSLRPRAGLFDVPRRFRAAAATRYCRA